MTGLRVFTLFAAACLGFASEPAELVGGLEEFHVMVPVSDGVRLSTWICRPKGPGPYPALYSQTPSDIRGENLRQEATDLARHGYAVVVQNIRGAHESEGTYAGYRSLAPGSVQDGRYSVDWIARQPWCNGKVGSFGDAEAGTAQNFLAASRPEDLAAQFLTDFDASSFHHIYRVGGTVRPQRVRAVSLASGATEDGERLLAEQLRHPTYDDWWATENTMLHFGNMDQPAMLVGGWFDRSLTGVIDAYLGRSRLHPDKVSLVVGPWVHGSSNKGNVKVGDLIFPSDAEHSVIDHQVRWFDHYLKGVENGVPDEPSVRYFVMGPSGDNEGQGNYWREADSWPPPSDESAYFLLDGSRLSADGSVKVRRSKTEWLSDPNHPATLEGNLPQSGRDQRPYESQSAVRTFTTEPLEEPVEWTGMVRARLFLSSTARDADIIVRLTDVYPDGRSILLTDQIKRLRFRNGFEREEFLEPNQIYKVEFDVAWISQIFGKGHRIRITLASTGAPYWEVNPQTGGPDSADFPTRVFVARNAVHHDPEHRSSVLAPLVSPVPRQDLAASRFQRFTDGPD